MQWAISVGHASQGLGFEARFSFKIINPKLQRVMPASMLTASCVLMPLLAASAVVSRLEDWCCYYLCSGHAADMPMSFADAQVQQPGFFVMITAKKLLTFVLLHMWQVSQ